MRDDKQDNMCVQPDSMALFNAGSFDMKIIASFLHDRNEPRRPVFPSIRFFNRLLHRSAGQNDTAAATACGTRSASRGSNGLGKI